MISVFIVKAVGFVIITAVLGFAWVLWVNASRLEEEIEIERNRSEDE